MASSAPASKSLAEEYGECPICYYDWSSKPAAVLLRADGRRSCRHFIHKSCVDSLIATSNPKLCPLCRAPFAGVKEVPSFERDPKGWFSCVDFDQNGRLSQNEILDVLQVLLKLNREQMEKGVKALWSHWDPDHSGDVDFEECCGKSGLLQYVKQQFARAEGKEPPALSFANREAFFLFWDQDGNGTLEKEEIIRAVIKTLRLDVSKSTAIRDYLNTIWPLIDPDNSGEIDLKEFCQRDGLGEQLIAYHEMTKSS